MLGYFPLLYKDELLYSTISRLHIHTGFANYKTTIKCLFGKDSMRATIDFPTNLDVLTKNISFKTITSDKLIDEHTMFPLYQPFLPIDRANDIKDKMKTKNNGSIHAKIGLSASRISPHTHLLFCQSCYDEDFEKCGEAYWHRIHQVPGVLVCPHHGCFLKKSGVKLPLVSYIAYIAPYYAVERGSSYVIESCLEIRDSLYLIAKDLDWLMNANLSAKPMNYYRELYVDCLKHKKLALPTRRVRQKALIKAIRSFYSAELLNMIGCDILDENESNWVKELTRKNRKTFHPLYHVLLIRFLFGSVMKFFEETNLPSKKDTIKGSSKTQPKKSVVNSDTVKNKRTDWLKLQEVYPLYTRKELRKVAGNLYMWLYRNDKEWLQLNSPTRKTTIPSYNRVNWGERDKAMLEEVKQICLEWNDSVKPVRKSIHSIIKRVKRGYLLVNYPDKLPLTNAFLMSQIETVEEFQIRRIKNVTEELRKENQIISEWQIYRKAGLRSTVTEKVRQFITYEVNIGVRR
ncbi:TnsD family Tn7-like transposition protein [Halalkalibacter akibai]|uniref:Tn7-like transposition protein D n=1 Tax=Halalkalibacter akibai (strain ATCC 43226 / DSM 21942 / CIP 109018 / JCM 9157 / 1139) TaxID=1236973 RepID=W4QZS7_HALA3|nr:TnsD family Tn7-like transposition protein [Halalkalibacter akibai]GAE36819.1 Tn7-like transposition protein D [Halalkalibacter akibai JCM 9157]